MSVRQRKGERDQVVKSFMIHYLSRPGYWRGTGGEASQAEAHLRLILLQFVIVS